ncbi:MAG: hypothetical protein KQI35_09265 [Bacteroidetes bacterium]|nr:hypothetical protein [Bacteroidota bacterium]
MKTLKLILLLTGLALYGQAFSFSLFNLPVDQVISNPVDNLLTVMADPILIKPVADNTNTQRENFIDTIVIDLAEVVVEWGFPGSARECISEQVPYPDFAQKLGIEGAVAIKFSFDDYGNVHVDEAMSNDPRLENYVKTQVENLHLRDCVVDVHKAYYMRFLFKLY